MGSFRRVLYSVLIGITLGTIYPLVLYLWYLMPNVFTNPLTLLEIIFALSTLYAPIIALLLYLRERSEHESQG
jgi:uncharacterized membrane protein YciS (DUF1049 family)